MTKISAIFKTGKFIERSNYFPLSIVIENFNKGIADKRLKTKCAAVYTNTTDSLIL